MQFISIVLSTSSSSYSFSFLLVTTLATHQDETLHMYVYHMTIFSSNLFMTLTIYDDVRIDVEIEIYWFDQLTNTIGEYFHLFHLCSFLLSLAFFAFRFFE